MRATVKKLTASWIGVATCAVFIVASQARASLVSVTGEFSSFTPDTAFSQSILTAYDASGGTTTLGLASGQTTALPSGTSKVDFNVGTSSSDITNTFAFTPGDPANVNVGDVFRLGSFTFTNGTWFDTIALTFSLTTHSANAALDNHVFAGTMDLVVNPNVLGDPYLSADYFYIAERPDLGSVRVFEKAIQPPGNPGFTGTVDLYGQIGSLIPTSFANPSGAAFLSPSVSSDPMVGAVPEPGTLSAMAMGLACLAFVARTTKRRAARSWV